MSDVTDDSTEEEVSVVCQLGFNDLISIFGVVVPKQLTIFNNKIHMKSCLLISINLFFNYTGPMNDSFLFISILGISSLVTVAENL